MTSYRRDVAELAIGDQSQEKRTNSRRRSARSCLVALMMLSAATPGHGRTFRGEFWEEHYLAGIGKVCPTKRLDLLSPSALLDSVENFRDELRPALRRKMKKIVGWDYKIGVPIRCRNLIGGASCPAEANLEGIYKIGLMSRFVRRICVSYKGCAGQSDCKTDPHAKGTLITYENGGEIQLPGHPATPWPPALPPLPPSAH